MKRNSLITAALLSLGLISSASASSTFGTTNVVYITGSTAFRANLWNTLTNTVANSNPTVFIPGSTPVATAGANSGTSQYNIIGPVLVGSVTNTYCISVDLTGSEAGIASLYNTASSSAFTYSVPVDAAIGQSTGTGQLPGTPLPTFITPDGGSTTASQTPDISFADTSFSVSLSNAKSAPVEYGCVGVVTFTWVKGKNSAPDSSWSDFSNVSLVQLPYELTTAQTANFFTGTAADTDKVYLIGRNEGSGTRVNTLCDLAQPISLNAVTQYALNNSTTSANSLTFGTIATFTSTSIAKNNTGVHLVPVGGDGFDAGSSVAKTLECDINGQHLITLGYLGMSDAATAVGGGGVYLTLDGTAENDGNIINGTYSFWGHEHVYGVPGQSTSSPGGVIAQLLVGTQAPGTPNTEVGTANGFSTTSSALEANGQFGNASSPSSNRDSAIDGAAMQSDKPSGEDYGYPSL